MLQIANEGIVLDNYEYPGNVQKSVYFFSYYESLGSPKKNNHIAFFNS